MIYDSVNLLEGADIQNLTIESGTSFPVSPVTAQLFFRSDASKLYSFNGTTWIEILQAGSAEVDIPKITSIVITDSTYAANGDTGINSSGGYIKVIGTGFKSGCTVYVGTVAASVTTFVSATEIRAQMPSITSGNYVIYVINADGTSGIYADGTSVLQVTDTNFKNVSALIKTTPTNNGQNNTFIDSSANNFTVTRNGNATQGSFSPFSPIGWSGYFNGTSDRLSVDGLLESITTGQFCMEMWIRPTKFNTAIASNFYWQIGQNGGWILGSNSSGNISFSASTPTYNSLPNVFTTTNSLTLAEWNHVVISRDSSNNLRCFINGQLGASVTYSTSLAVNTNAYTNVRVGLQLGASGPWDGSYTSFFEGYISNFRIVLGSALYTSAFTPPSAELTAITDTKVLLVSNPYLKDLSSNNYSITNTGVDVVNASPFSPATSYSPTTHGSSVYFDGNGDYLSLPSTFNSAMGGGLASGTKLNTIEAWIFPTIWTPLNAYKMGIYGNFEAVSANGRFVLQVLGNATSSNGKVEFSYTTGTGTQVSLSSQSSSIPLNAWTHIAITIDATTSSSSVIKFFVNGILTDTFTAQNLSTQTANYTAPFLGGNTGTSINSWAGYISNFRHTYGSLVYTSNFTPSTTPLTAVAGTSLLLKGTGANIYDASCNSNIATESDAKVSTTIKKYGDSSIVSDGSNDYMVAPASHAFELLNDNFTVEFWAYFTNGSEVAERVLFSMTDGTSTNNFYMSKSNTGSYAGKLCVFAGNNSTTTALLVDNTYPASASWIHFAITRSGNTFTLWENGVSVATGTFSGNVTTSGAKLYLFGTGGATTFQGNIQDFRITKGIARYTSTFTPPVSALPSR